MAFIAKQRYRLDITPRGGWVIVYASQHDDEAREIEFEIINQGSHFSIPASLNVSVQGIKSNGGYFSHSCTYSGNIVTMPLADDMTDVIGKAVCVLKFTNTSNQKLATAKFILNVDIDSSSSGIIIDTDAEEIFNQMLNDIRAQAASISADIAELQSMVGTPLVASTASAMTDHNKIYVYVGSESGYTNGNWYYWNGSAWTSGGIYNAVAFETDKTLSVEDMPADAKVVGDEFKNVANLGNSTGADYSPWTSGKTILNTGKIGTSNTNSACSEFIRIPNFATAVVVSCGAYSGVVGLYTSADESSFITRVFISANGSTSLDLTSAKYIRVAIGSTDTSNASTLHISIAFIAKTEIINLGTRLTANEAKTTKAVSTDNTYATGISANTDYDTITTSGNYYCSSSANAQSMTHCPVTVAHRLTVIATTASARLIQVVIPNNNNVPWNYRYYDGTSWGEWLAVHTKNNSIQTDGIVITADNYADYFTDFNNAPLNSVFYVRKDLPIDNYPEGFMSVLNPGDTHGKPAGTLVTIKSGVISGITSVLQLYSTDTGDPDGGLPNPYLCVRQGIVVSGAMQWSKWGRMGEAMSVTSTNEGIPNSRILSGDAPFSDFDDAPINTIYQVDLNAVDMANNPMRGHSCVLITQAYSTITRHGIVQYCIGVDVVTKMYFRYGYLNQPTVMAWTDWQEVCTSPDEYMRNKGSLANNTNLNSITGNVIYLLGASNTYPNAPISGVALWLTAKKVGNITSQTIERLNGNRCTRYTTDNGSTWNTWSEWK